MVFGINNDSMVANFSKNLHKNSGNIDLFSQRLATGLRINSAQDDAANLGLSEKLKATISSSNILKNNASQGGNMLQTLDGDLEDVWLKK